MRTATTLLLLLLLASCMTACGGASRLASDQVEGNGYPEYPAVGTAISVTTHSDRDNDGDHNDDDGHLLAFGHVASPTDRRAITALIMSFYAAAASEDGARACSLLAPFLAESMADEYANSPAIAAPTCARVLTKIFTVSHAQIESKSAAVRVLRVGIKGDRVLVALYFPEVPEVRQMTVRRVADSWRVISLLDGILE